MDVDFQLQVTDKELKELPEEIQPKRSQDTRPPTKQLLATQPVGKESLIQMSDPILAAQPIRKESLV